MHMVYRLSYILLLVLYYSSGKVQPLVCHYSCSQIKVTYLKVISYNITVLEPSSVGIIRLYQF